MDLGERAIPTPAHLVTLHDPLARVAATISTQEAQRRPPNKVVPHPAAKFFPGNAPAGANPLAKTVAIDTRVPLWHGTGLYAPPGARLSIQIPTSSAAKGLAVRIGCHTDENWSCDDWSRMPAISRSFALDGPLTIAANAFGGLVYVEVPDKCKLGEVTVTIRGAIEAPRFVLGETSRDDWNKRLINLPGPWAELETKMGTVYGKTPGEGHEDDCKPKTIARRTRAHIAAGSPFAAWQDDPFLALAMYVQLRHEFGWEAYKRVFAEYRGLSPQRRPKNDQEKRDQWMVRFSRTVGRNLGPFLEQPFSSGSVAREEQAATIRLSGLLLRTSWR